MSEDPDPTELIDRTADERLLGEDFSNLPLAVGRPEATPPPSVARRRIVGVGATLTGLTLVLGILLVVVGVGEALSNAIALAIAAIAVGVLFIGTHWGWVHVAEVTANSLEHRRDSAVLDNRRLWLQTIKPYTRHEVTTSVEEDGSIKIICLRHRPVAAGERGFTFVREVEREELHSADEPSAVVTERAELLRRQAAAQTEDERERFEIAADAYETALLNRDDAQQRHVARRAASEALSERINSNLRDPPLVE